MKKKISFILVLTILVQAFFAFSTEKAEAAPPTKTITHTIIQSSWSKSKDEGPLTYYYDDGLHYGTLTKTSTTWETRTSSSTNSRTGYSNSKFDEDNPSEVWSFSYMEYTITNDYNYQGVAVTSMYWNGSNEGPGEYYFYVSDGKGDYEKKGPYKYKRSFRVEYNYSQFRYTSNYSGTVTARTIPPAIRISNPIGNSKYHNQDKIIVEGYAKDEDKGDKNVIYYSIEDTNHINKTVNLTNPTQIIATGNDMFFQGNIQLDQMISPGKYKLRIWAKDDKGADSNIIEVPIDIYNVLENIQNDIERYIPIEKQNNLRVIIPNTKDTMSASTVNNSIINNIKDDVQNRDAEMFFVGQGGSVETYIRNSLTNQLGRYGVYSKDNTSYIVDYILEENAKLLEKNTNIFLVGDFINYQMLFKDIEKDYLEISLEDKLKDNLPEEKMKAKILQAIYGHNPNIFDNPVHKHPKSSGEFRAISSIKDPYIIDKADKTMRGHWTLTIKGLDDTGKVEWDKYSDDKALSFIIHEPPKAIIEYWKEETDTVVYATGENSFDIDFQYSGENNGIVKSEWKYQLEDGSWHYYSNEGGRITIPKTLGGQKVINYSLTVEDCYGATDTAIAAIKQPVLMEPEPIIVAPKEIYVGPYGSEVLNVNNDSEPKSRILSYQYIFDFKSINNYINTTQNTVVNASSYTFEKNTLRYETSKNPFTRSVTLKLKIDTGAVKEATQSIVFTPVTIDKLDMTTISANTITFKADIINSNPSDHRVIATIKGIDYDMNYINGTRWERNLNISGADKIYIRVEKKVDNTIVYDKGEIIANRPPIVSIKVSPSLIYEGDTAKVSIVASDPDLDKLNLTVKHRNNGGSWSTIWTKDNVDSGVEQNFNIYNVAAGNNELMVIATDPHNATGTDTISFEVLPIKITGELLPNPAMAGDEVWFFITTEGYVENIEIVVPDDIIAKDNRVAMGYKPATYPLFFNVDGSIMTKEDVFKYIVWVSTDLTLDKNNNRLRPPYKFIIKAHKGNITRETVLELDIKRDIRELIKPGIKNKNRN